jgi:hypothetical protein
MAMSFHSSTFAFTHMNLNSHIAKIDLQNRDINIYQVSTEREQPAQSKRPAGGRGNSGDLQLLQ